MRSIICLFSFFFFPCCLLTIKLCYQSVLFFTSLMRDDCIIVMHVATGNLSWMALTPSLVADMGTWITKGTVLHYFYGICILQHTLSMRATSRVCDHQVHVPQSYSYCQHASFWLHRSNKLTRTNHTHSEWVSQYKLLTSTLPYLFFPVWKLLANLRLSGSQLWFYPSSHRAIDICLFCLTCIPGHKMASVDPNPVYDGLTEVYQLTWPISILPGPLTQSHTGGCWENCRRQTQDQEWRTGVTRLKVAKQGTVANGMMSGIKEVTS